MFGLYQRLRSLVIGEEEEDRGGSKTSAVAIPPGHAKDPERKREERFFSGVVTSMRKDSGMIDHRVFFALDAVIGGARPVEGSTVHVHAAREHVHAGWQAERVEVTSRWRPESVTSRQVRVGFVAGLSQTLGTVDCGTDEIPFSPRESVADGYRPHVNDWVQVCLLSEDDETTVTDVRPLREKTIVDAVTSLSQGFGLIRDDVYFTFSACARGYRPAVGERVTARCVEYKHPRSSWRAMHVEPQPPRSAPVLMEHFIEITYHIHNVPGQSCIQWFLQSSQLIIV